MQIVPPQEELRRTFRPTRRQMWLAALIGGFIGLVIALLAWAFDGSWWWWAAVPIGAIGAPSALRHALPPVVWCGLTRHCSGPAGDGTGRA